MEQRRKEREEQEKPTRPGHDKRPRHFTHKAKPFGVKHAPLSRLQFLTNRPRKKATPELSVAPVASTSNTTLEPLPQMEQEEDVPMQGDDNTIKDQSQAVPSSEDALDEEIVA